MKTIGLIGGMSWESSIEYYRIINEVAKDRLGGLHSAKCVMYSVDFGEIEPLMKDNRWDVVADALILAARSVEQAGADFLVICTNTMHKLAGDIQAAIHIPLLHIANATGDRIRARGCSTVALLGTRFTMEEKFYRERLSDQYGVRVIIPDSPERNMVDRVIFDELCRGKIVPSSKTAYLGIMDTLVKAGAEGIILGCTEIGLLVHQEDSRVPLFDTARIHAEAAVDFALKGP